jgi:hypothetical protein
MVGRYLMGEERRVPVCGGQINEGEVAGHTENYFNVSKKIIREICIAPLKISQLPSAEILGTVRGLRRAARPSFDTD